MNLPSMRSRAKGLLSSVTTWLVLTQLVTAGAAFLLNLLSSASLDPADRGILALFLQIGYLLTALSMLGVEKPYIATAGKPIRSALGELQRLAAPGLVMCSMILLILAGILWMNGVANWDLVGLGAVFVIGNLHLLVLRSGSIASTTWWTYVLTTLGCQILLVFGGVCLSVAGVNDLTLWVLLYVGSTLIATIITLPKTNWSAYRVFRGSSSYRTSRDQGLRLLPASLGSVSMQRADRFLLPLLASPAALGIYVMAATAVSFSAWPIQQWSDTKLEAWASSKDRHLRRVLAPMGVAFIVTMVFGLIISGVVWISIDKFLGTAYEPAKSLLPVLVASAVIYSLTRVQQGMMIALGQAGRVSISEITGMSISVCACFLLIPLFGALGAALSVLAGNLGCLIAATCYWAASNRKFQTEQ